MKLLDRKPEENARSYAIRVLLFNIINLELPPGSAVSENELSSVMMLSRTPIREALIELSRMNLVEILPQRGSYITKIDYDLIEESRFMRLVLETAVLKLACEQGVSDSHMEHLKRILKMEREFIDSEDFAIQLDLDNHFHKTILNPSTSCALTIFSVPRWFILTVSEPYPSYQSKTPVPSMITKIFSTLWSAGTANWQKCSSPAT